MFNDILEVKKKTVYRRVRYAKSKRKSFKFRNKPWALKQKRKGD